ncbi:MAG: CAP domain-containing protein, partial [Paracoccaceae bacterium]
MTITAAEQYLLELINRARLNPGAEALRLGIDLNYKLDPGTLTNTARQVLAPNEKLDLAASLHSIWMLNTDIFDHIGANKSQPWDRADAQGYDWWTIGENISVRSIWGDLASAIDSHQSGLFISAGHRTNILEDGFREIGLGQEEGQFAFTSGTYRSSMLTELFGSSGSNFYLTGVAYTDSDKNAFYTMGEGRSGVVFNAGGASDTTA